VRYCRKKFTFAISSPDEFLSQLRPRPEAWSPVYMYIVYLDQASLWFLNVDLHGAVSLAGILLKDS